MFVKGPFRIILEKGRDGATLSVLAVLSSSRSSCSVLESEDLKSSIFFLILSSTNLLYKWCRNAKVQTFSFSVLNCGVSSVTVCWFQNISFFLSFFPFFLLSCSNLSLPVEGYCCTWSHSETDTHTHTHSVGLLWTRDRRVTESSSWQHTTFTRDNQGFGEIRTRSPKNQKAADLGLVVPKQYSVIFRTRFSWFWCIRTFTPFDSVHLYTDYWFDAVSKKGCTAWCGRKVMNWGVFGRRKKSWHTRATVPSFACSKCMMMMMMMMIIIIIIIITYQENMKTWSQRTTENSRIGHCTHTSKSTNVKVQKIQHWN